MHLSAKQQEQFWEEGYLIFSALLTEEKRAKYKALFAELEARAAGLRESQDGYCLAPDAEGKPIPGRLHKIQGVCLVDARVLELVKEPEILDRVEALIGPNIDAFGTKFYPMSVAGATSTGWHQDNYYFGTRSDQVISCATYLDPTDRESGCLQILPGSHCSGEIVPHERGTGIYAHGNWVEVDESRAVDVVCPGGTVVLFAANVLHGARANHSGRPSYRTAWHYIPGDLALEQFPRGVYKDRHIVRGH
jgi:hypothetical protein